MDAAPMQTHRAQSSTRHSRYFYGLGIAVIEGSVGWFIDRVRFLEGEYIRLTSEK